MNNYVNLILCIHFIFYRPFTNVHVEKKPQLTNVDMAYYNSNHVHVEFFFLLSNGLGGLPTHCDINRLRDDVCG